MNVGFLQVYNEIDWIKYSIDHAMNFCDKLIIIEGSQFVNFKKIPERSTDGTLDIIYEKMKEFHDKIELINTIRKFPNYRDNQAANFNLALSRCDDGDYFIPFDVDEFFFDDFIEKINQLTKEGEVDLIITSGLNLAFSFKWRIIFNDTFFHYPKESVFKKNNKLYFVRTHKPLNYGPNVTVFDKGDCLIHYKWVRSKERLYIRHKTSKFYKHMSKWFNKNWEKIELIQNKRYKYYGGYFYLEKYEGPHPTILDKHPWRNIEDIRKV